MGAINDTCGKNKVDRVTGGTQLVNRTIGAAVRAVKRSSLGTETYGLSFGDLSDAELDAIEAEISAAGPAGAIAWQPLEEAAPRAFRVSEFRSIRPAMHGATVFGATMTLTALPGVPAPS